MANSLLVVIDVSLNDNIVRILHPDGTSLSKFVVANSVLGAKILSKRVTEIKDKYCFDSLVIGLESTSVYGDPLVYFIKQDASVNRFSTKIHVLNPTQVKKFRMMYPDLPKTDAIDAWVIAEHLCFRRIIKEVYMDDRYNTLQKLTRARFRTVQNLTLEKNWFLNNLSLKFSSLAQEKIFSDRFGATSSNLIEEFLSVDEIAYMPIEELVEFINKKSRRRFDNPLLLLSKMLPLTSIKGIGPVYAAGIVAEIGDIHRF